MQVILLQRVAKLGHMGEVVKVRDGYARNFLLPQGKALRATETNIANFATRKADLEAKNSESRAAAQAEAAALDGQIFVLIRQASESGALYGSVTARDAADAAQAAGFAVEKRQGHAGKRDMSAGALASARLREALELFDVGVRLTQLSPQQAGYIGVPSEGPFKPEHYRY